MISRSPFLRIMSNAQGSECNGLVGVGLHPLSWLALLLALLLGTSASFGQNKAALQAQRDALEKKLATTERLLSEAASNKNDALVSLRLIDERMLLREQLINHHRAEIRAIERSMTSTDLSLIHI